MKRVFTPEQNIGRLAASRRWRMRNREHMRRLKYAAYRRAHPVPQAPADPTAKTRAKRAWKLRNPDRVAADRAQRRALEIRAIPQWADRVKTREVYAHAKLLTDLTGIPHHVDHLVPLRGRLVCGLHVHYNLQVLSKDENMRKGNRFQETS